MAKANPLGEYLRARRELADPASAGLRTLGVRRTPGLRREEVATLAGISSDYYLRLEQGRDRNPSPQVLEALAKVFGLDTAATTYLLSLTAPRPSSRTRRKRETVPAGILQLLDSIELPAVVENRLFDVLAANPLATALFPGMAPGQNRLRAVFLDEGERVLFRDWDAASASMVASFRASIGTATDDPRIVQLVGELSLGSERFRQLWARHDVNALAGGTALLDHPQVGLMDLRREKLSIGDTDGLLLAIYHAAPGSAAARSLATLGTLAPPASAESTTSRRG